MDALDWNADGPEKSDAVVKAADVHDAFVGFCDGDSNGNLCEVAQGCMYPDKDGVEMCELASFRIYLGDFKISD